MTDRTCEILVGTRIVKGTAPRPVSDKLAEAMTKEEKRQVLEEVRTELDEEVRNIWEPVLTPMSNLMCVNKLENYAQFRTPHFVRIGLTEPEIDEQPIAAAIQLGTCVLSFFPRIRHEQISTLLSTVNTYPRSVTIGLTVASGNGIAHQTNIPKEQKVHPPNCGEHPTMRTLEVTCMTTCTHGSSCQHGIVFMVLQGLRAQELACPTMFLASCWLKQYPDSIYNVSKGTFKTLEPGESRGANSVEMELPQALAIQELQVLPKDIDKHFSELAKAHPISMKAVRNTDGKEREKWKESMGKELKGLVDRETYDEVSSTEVPLSQVQNAPARMVYVVKPAIADDGTRFVKRKWRLVNCGNFLNPYGETSTANLDISVLRTLISVGLTNKWRFASADIPQAFLYASIEQGQNVYLKPPKICVDFGLVGKDTLWRLKRALYGLRESPKALGERKR
eukprot:4875830-Amphidinium_carterae.2